MNAGGSSAYSNLAGGTTPPNPPAAPSNLSALGVSTSQINLAWQDNSTNETQFELQRRTAGGNFGPSIFLPANTSQYADTGLTPGQAYVYRIRALNGGGPSDWSNEAPASTLATCSITLTSPVGGETWSINSAHNITWNSVAAGSTIRIEVSRDGGSTWSTLTNGTPNNGSYSWSVTGPTTTQARVRVSSVSVTGCQDTSRSNFTVANPDGGVINVVRNFAFGNQKVNTTKTKALTIGNLSTTEDLVVNLAAPTGPFGIQGGAQSLRIPPGGHQDVQLTFTPKKKGAATGKLTITSTDRNNPSIDVKLTGTGT